MNVELYFNGQLADFDNEDVIAGTYALNKLGELNSRQGYFTNSYNLPRSNKNKRIFGNPDEPNSVSSIPYTLLTHKVLIEGVEVFNGFAKVERSKDVYEVTGFAGNADFFALIKDKSIRDLDLSEWEHIRDDATIQASWANTDGYIYAFLDYGKYRGVAPVNNEIVVDAADLYPAVYFHTLIERIASEAGYELSGKVLNHPRYKAMVIPWNGATSTADTDGYRFSGHIDVFNLPPNGTYTIPPLTVDEDGESQYNEFGFYVARNGQSVKITLEHTGISNGSQYIIVKRSYANPSLSGEIEAGDDVIAGGGLPEGSSGRFPVTTTLVPGDKLFVAYRTIGAQTGVSVRVDEFTVDVLVFTDTFQGPWDVSLNLPDIGQDKLFLEFMVQFGLIPFPDVENGVIELVYFDDIEKNPAVDWSRKIDDSEEPEVSFRFGTYAQRNTLTYRTDSPDPNNQTGITDGKAHIFEINDQVLEPINTAYESQFYLPDEGPSVVGVANLNPRIYFRSSVDEAEKPFRGKWYSTESYVTDEVVFHDHLLWIALANNSNSEPATNNNNWRIVAESEIWQIQAKDIIGVVETCPPITVQFDSGTASLDKVISAKDMSWPEIYAEHYGVFDEVIQNTMIVKLLLKLNYADINQLDLTRPIYIDRYGCFFYCDIIEQFKFNSVDSTYVTLVRI